MFERFTEVARRVVVEAQAIARAESADEITLDHMRRGLYQAQLGPSEVVAVNDPRVPFSSPAKKSLELALRDALSRGDNYIGVQHITAGIERAAAAK